MKVITMCYYVFYQKHLRQKHTNAARSFLESIPPFLQFSWSHLSTCIYQNFFNFQLHISAKYIPSLKVLAGITKEP